MSQPQRLLLLPDSFKGSLTAVQAVEAMQKAIHDSGIAFETVGIPASDGGEGFLDAIEPIFEGTRIQAVSTDALGRPITAWFLWSHERKEAAIEMATASGLIHLAPEEYNLWKASTYGTGTLIQMALDLGAKHILLGMGGSATNDGGCGALQALGVKVTKADRQSVGTGAEALAQAKHLDFKEVHFALKNCKITLAVDVRNPLVGMNGATYSFARQKGASEKDLPKLEHAMQNWVDSTQKYGAKVPTGTHGIGAAGGLAYGLSLLSNTTLRSGFKLFAEMHSLEEKIKSADWILTGEGCLDEQSLNGKVVGELSKMTREARKKLVVFCGNNLLLPHQYSAHGIDAVIELEKSDHYQNNASKRLYEAILQWISDLAM